VIQRPRLALPVAVFAFCTVLAACGGSLATPSLTASPTASGGQTSDPSPTPTAGAVEVLYVVQDGDTLAGIADQFGVTVDAIMQANSIADADSLQVGDVLTIPGVTVTPIPATDAPTEAPAATDPPAGEVTTLQLVDKQHALPANYVPPDLTPVPAAYVAPGYSATMNATALQALQQMLDAAQAKGYDVRVVSGYRSYADQQYTYNYWVQQLGQEEGDRVSARPGHSEHQLGTTADLGSAAFGWDLREDFGSTPEGQWLDENGAAYGFVVSYPEGKEATTGHAYEPWHLRYVGPDAAEAYKASGLTLNQYLATL
jgi:D-alanyl-D-alanine carboxypeptidase